MKKLLSIFSIASITTILFTSPLWAKPINYRGEKGTYTIDSQAGTYRGCLKSSGCIFLGRKYFVPCKGIECETRAWKKGEYVYAIGGENELSVSKNGQFIFTDYLSIVKTSSKSQKSVATKLNTKKSKILDGDYVVGQTDGMISVKGNKYQFSSEGNDFGWKSTSLLEPVRKGVIRAKSGGEYWEYWCLIKMAKKNWSYCTEKGWVYAKKVAK